MKMLVRAAAAVSMVAVLVGVSSLVTAKGRPLPPPPDRGDPPAHRGHHRRGEADADIADETAGIEAARRVTERSDHEDPRARARRRKPTLG